MALLPHRVFVHCLVPLKVIFQLKTSAGEKTLRSSVNLKFQNIEFGGPEPTRPALVPSEETAF
jgi:hypothetical protein